MEEDEELQEPRGLPAGVDKEILKEAPDTNFHSPTAGDEVTVHYVGTLQDGQEFDSSRSRNKAFTFSLGQGQVIPGWDLGVASMRKGEVAKFILAPEFAYGDAGSPPKIPEKATLIFEIELLDFVSKDDLFGDGGLVKVLQKEGSGWKVPKNKSEQRISLKICKADGCILEDKGSFDFLMGSEALGPLTKAVEKALLNMKKGEECKLICRKDYAYGEEDLLLLLGLEELYEIQDVSLAKDKSIMKKQIKEGEGYEKPKECWKVFLKVETATDGKSQLPGFLPKTLEFVAGDGCCCDALECASFEMKRGELCQVTSGALWCREPQLGLEALSVPEVVFTLELLNFEKVKDTWDMSEEEKIDFAHARKDVGARLFKEGRYSMAMERYKKIVDLFNYVDSYKEEENKVKAKELKKVCKLNRAACQLKVGLFAEAKASCDTVLKDDSHNVKALFRRAQAQFALKMLLECAQDVKKVLDLEPNNREARALAKEVAKAQKEEDQKSKGVFGKMCQALGTGPIREPYVDRRFDFDAEERLQKEAET